MVFVLKKNWKPIFLGLKKIGTKMSFVQNLLTNILVKTFLKSDEVSTDNQPTRRTHLIWWQIFCIEVGRIYSIVQNWEICLAALNISF